MRFFSAQAEREAAILQHPFICKMVDRGNPLAANLILSAATAMSTKGMRTAQVGASQLAADQAGNESSSSDAE